MLLRKPTAIQLKPEDDYAEYEEFVKRQEQQKKGSIAQNQLFPQQTRGILGFNRQGQQFVTNNQFSSIQLAQSLNQYKSNTLQTETAEGSLQGDSSWLQANPHDQVPINQLFQMMAPDFRQQGGNNS